MNYYKDNQKNVFAYSDIQTPKDGLIKITEQEAMELTNPPPTAEQIAEEKAEQLKRDIVELEMKQFRSLKAIMREATEEDEEIYNEIEAEIQAKREEIRGLENERR